MTTVYRWSHKVVLWTPRQTKWRFGRRRDGSMMSDRLEEDLAESGGALGRRRYKSLLGLLPLLQQFIGIWPNNTRYKHLREINLLSVHSRANKHCYQRSVAVFLNL